MFDSILSSTLNPVTFFVCLGVAFVLGLIVALTHQKTARSSANFTTTLAVLPTLVTMAIMLVNGNLGAGVATVGVFSLVRFRSIAGNSRSILGVFFTMAIGLACGTGYITFAALFTIVISLILVALKTLHFGEGVHEQQLKVLVPEDLDYPTLFDDVFAAYTTRYELIKAKTTNMGSLFELTYRICLKGNINEKKFIDQIRTKNGNLKVMLSHELEDETL